MRLRGRPGEDVLLERLGLVKQYGALLGENVGGIIEALREDLVVNLAGATLSFREYPLELLGRDRAEEWVERLVGFGRCSDRQTLDWCTRGG